MSENTVCAAEELSGKKRTVGTYIGWLILSSFPVWLPLIGYIVVAVLAFGGKDAEKKRFFRASFILHTVCIVLFIVSLIVVFGVFGDQIKPFISANY
ncbi:MAG: hypothetical protein IJL26_11325 [Clostridia bacterium]|nr:hypothetical protein [Clostridia bacterium]